MNACKNYEIYVKIILPYYIVCQWISLTNLCPGIQQSQIGTVLQSCFRSSNTILSEPRFRFDLLLLFNVFLGALVII